MIRSAVFLLVCLLVLGVAVASAVVDESGAVAEPVTSPDDSILMGVAFSTVVHSRDPRYLESLPPMFEVMVPHPAFKWQYIQPEPGTWEFERADEAVELATSLGMQVRGHTFVFGLGVPDWVREEDWSPESLMTTTCAYITEVIERYRDDIAVWDVVNEALDFNGNYRQNLYHQTIGPEYIELAFECAHAADPDALLFYNDFGAEDFSRKGNAVYAMVADLVDRGVPIHGVGMQLHVNADAWPYRPNVRNIERNIERLEALGLVVHFTEVQVRVGYLEGSIAEKWACQAHIYGTLLDICLNQPACELFNVWGYTDQYSWLYDHYGIPYPVESPLVYDAEFMPKPAYIAMQGLLDGTGEVPSADLCSIPPSDRW